MRSSYRTLILIALVAAASLGIGLALQRFLPIFTHADAESDAPPPRHGPPPLNLTGRGGCAKRLRRTGSSCFQGTWI